MAKKFAFNPPSYEQGGGDYVPDHPSNMLSGYSFHVTDKKTGRITHHASESHLIKSYPKMNHVDIGAALEYSGMRHYFTTGDSSLDNDLHAEDDQYKVRASPLKGASKRPN